MHNDVITVALASSKFAPVAIGFFGLATGDLVAGICRKHWLSVVPL